MFAITTKGNYGISAILELAENFGKGLTQIKDIAQKRDIPKQYLDQIFNRLVRTGILKSYRGNKGGYELGEDPKNLSLLRILEILEGEIELAQSYKKEDAVRAVLKKTEEQIKENLDVSIADILLAQQKFEKKVMYYI